MKQLWQKFADMFKKSNELMKSANAMHRFAYRVVDIEELEQGHYQVTVQVSGKSTVFKTTPSKLLADDNMVDQFSQRDIRALTYLGYHEIHSPKYHILATKHIKDQSQTVFAVKKRGEEEVMVKTAAELSSDKEIVSNLSQEQAHMLGFTSGTEQTSDEQRQMQELKKQRKK